MLIGTDFIDNLRENIEALSTEIHRRRGSHSPEMQKILTKLISIPDNFDLDKDYPNFSVVDIKLASLLIQILYFAKENNIPLADALIAKLFST